MYKEDRKRKKELRARNAARIVKAESDFPALAEKWKSEPHPVLIMARDGFTRYDWARWIFRYASIPSKVKLAKMIEKELELKAVQDFAEEIKKGR